jgi:ribosomal-protein-alanine N-acetyltransferase
MQEAINYWLWEYERKGFVRGSIIDKDSKEVIGTIELFTRNSNDYFNYIYTILSIIILPTYELFHCDMIATKAVPQALERIEALKRKGFHLSDEKLIGHDQTVYDNYWVCRND